MNTSSSAKRSSRANRNIALLAIGLLCALGTCIWHLRHSSLPTYCVAVVEAVDSAQAALHSQVADLEKLVMLFEMRPEIIYISAEGARIGIDDDSGKYVEYSVDDVLGKSTGTAFQPLLEYGSDVALQSELRGAAALLKRLKSPMVQRDVISCGPAGQVGVTIGYTGMSISGSEILLIHSSTGFSPTCGKQVPNHDKKSWCNPPTMGPPVVWAEVMSKWFVVVIWDG